MLTAKQKSDIPLLPAGMHRARCVSVIDLGTQPSGNPQYSPSHKVMLEWELPDETYERREDGKDPITLPRKMARQFGLTLGKKSTLRAVLESWRGREFTPEELDGFDVSKLLGAPCFLNIIHAKQPTGTFANVSSVSPLPKLNLATMPPQFYPSVQYNLEQGQDVVFASLPEWIRGKILQCEEWNKATDTAGAVHEGSPDDMVGEGEESVPF